MENGLAAYLERKACQLRLFRLTEDPGKATLKAGWSVKTNAARYHRDEQPPIFYTVDTKTPGYLYLLDQDADGIVQMGWPIPEDLTFHLTPGQHRLGYEKLALSRDTPEGRTRLRAILVAPSADAAIPPLEPPDGQSWTTPPDPDGKYAINPAYWEAERRHLRALVKALETGKARWAAFTLEYEVD
jgi:hypothetical protein